MTKEHKEYQKAIREVLAPTLDYKKRWEELKVQMQYERESAYESVSYSKSYARLEDTLFNQGQYEAFKKVQAIMEKLEKS
jgi:hypothetical protein